MTLESFFVLFRPLANGAGAVLTFVGAILVLSPRRFLETLGLQDYPRGEAGLALLFGIGILLAVQFSDSKSMFQRARQRRAERNAKTEERDRRRAKLKRLTPDEKALLVRYRDGATSLPIDPANGIAMGLDQQGILHRTAINGMTYKVALNLYPWVRELLQEEPGLLEGATPPAAPRTRR